MPTMFVNLPVTDLERAKAFYTALGFTINPLFTDHNAACVVVEAGPQLLHDPGARVPADDDRAPARRPRRAPHLGDGDLPRQPGRRSTPRSPPASPRAARRSGEPQDFGFMYQRGLTDPDGNPIDFGWMDPIAAAQGPEAFMNQQA